MTAITRQYVTAGYAIVTVGTSPDAQAAGFAPHYTYLIEKVELPASGQWPAATRWFVKSLTGPDNTKDYVYLGMVCPVTGALKLTAKSAFPETSHRVRVLRRVLSRVWANDTAAIEAAGWTLHHEGFCGRCGRPLTVPGSVESGYGPECITKVLGVTMVQWVKANMKCAAV